MITYLDCEDEYYQDYLSQIKVWQESADVLVFAYDLAEEQPAEGQCGMQIWSPAGPRAGLPWRGMAAPLGLAHRRELPGKLSLSNQTSVLEAGEDLWTRLAGAGASFLFIPHRSGLCRSRRPPEASQARATWQPETWSIGIYAGPSPLDLAPPPGVTNPVLTAADVTDLPAAFVADPFLTFAGGRWYMFFEVMPSASQTGIIGLAESPDGLRWKYRRVVLREAFHLSYPHVFEWEGNYYMTPETLAAGCVRLYRAADFPERWEHVGDLVAGQHADPTVFRAADAWWMFTCSDPLFNHTLRLFRAASLTGPWAEHPHSPIIARDPRFARLAGRVIESDNGWLRFTQDCSVRYGLQVWGFHITTLTPADYREELARPIPILAPATVGWNRRGMHHLDAHPAPGATWLAAVDGFS